MKKISQARTIYEAFKASLVGQIPRNERDYPEWYKYRLDKCAECKYNTKNIPRKFLPVDLWVPTIMGKARCSVCTCFIKEKAWMRSEECGLAETKERPSFLTPDYLDSKKGDNDTPRWKRLEVVTADSDEFDIVATNTDLYDIDLSDNGEYFVMNFPHVEQGSRLFFDFIIRTKSRLKFFHAQPSCQCTAPFIRDLGRGEHLVDVEISTEKWNPGKFEKRIVFDFASDPESKKDVKNCPVRFNINIIPPEKKE